MIKKFFFVTLIVLLVFPQLACINTEKFEKEKMYQKMRQDTMDILLKELEITEVIEDQAAMALHAKYAMILESERLLLKPLTQLAHSEKKFLLFYLLVAKNPGHPSNIDKQYAEELRKLGK